MKYETNTNRLKLCALCDSRIVFTEILCKEHAALFETYKTELWFQALVAAQQRQYEIDVAEFRLLFGKTSSSLQKSTKPRSKLTITDKKHIIRLYDSGKGWRRISKELNLNPYAVNKFIYRLKRKR